MKTKNYKSKASPVLTKKILILAGSVAIILSILAAGIVLYLKKKSSFVPSPSQAQTMVANEQLKELDALRSQLSSISSTVVVATSSVRGASAGSASVKAIVGQQLNTLNSIRRAVNQLNPVSSSKQTAQQQLEELNQLRSK